MKFLKKGLAVLFACTFVSVPLYHPVKADAVIAKAVMIDNSFFLLFM